MMTSSLDHLMMVIRRLPISMLAICPPRYTQNTTGMCIIHMPSFLFLHLVRGHGPCFSVLLCLNAFVLCFEVSVASEVKGNAKSEN
jgi:hypothetical protein